eukprot:CAMPEP_0116999576 /NCGR_PEP_ID=MMETSP0472-20121206/2234_1 /TAXON_ID=693140 ORGANISM="Tiarina fusus, Strain LIS" /NCGR_SAMPLE_ID=MMETSP0472 /ASSEMBLY_ACC=CAM_ASM_000603 /LENGTH=305 /DNA_ID=CAMNT_0004699039 /DNA_START=46 /DNA_END=963 /DNA_ORIENTATION=-
MSFETFMQNLVGVACNETINIVADNATLPSPAVLSCGRRNRNEPKRTILSGVLPSFRPKLNRYHSEPIKYDTFLQAPRVSSRWSCGLVEARNDEVLKAPKRATSRWCVSRIHSDSVLISPKRTAGMPECHSRITARQGEKITLEPTFKRKKSSRRLQRSSPLFEADESDVIATSSEEKQLIHDLGSPQLNSLQVATNKHDCYKGTAASTGEVPKKEELDKNPTSIQALSYPNPDAGFSFFLSVGYIVKTIERDIVTPTLLDSTNHLLNIIAAYVNLIDLGNRTGGSHFPFRMKNENHGLPAVAPP